MRLAGACLRRLISIDFLVSVFSTKIERTNTLKVEYAIEMKFLLGKWIQGVKIRVNLFTFTAGRQNWLSRSRQHVDDELRMCKSVQLASATSDRSSSSHSTSMLKVSLKQTWTAAKKTSTGSHDSLSQHNLHNHLAVHLMEWSDKHDLVLCREVLVMEPYQHPYRSNKRGDV